MSWGLSLTIPPWCGRRCTSCFQSRPYWKTELPDLAEAVQGQDPYMGYKRSPGESQWGCNFPQFLVLWGCTTGYLSQLAWVQIPALHWLAVWLQWVAELLYTHSFSKLNRYDDSLSTLSPGRQDYTGLCVQSARVEPGLLLLCGSACHSMPVLGNVPKALQLGEKHQHLCWVAIWCFSLDFVDGGCDKQPPKNVSVSLVKRRYGSPHYTMPLISGFPMPYS